MTNLAPNLHWHPRLAEGCDRLNARAKAENEAEERRFAIERARKIIRKPKGYTDAQLRTACGFYMAHGDGGPDYMLADQHIFAINKRQQIARNKAQFQATLAAMQAEETPAKIAMRYRKSVAALGLGLWLAVVVATVFGWAVL